MGCGAAEDAGWRTLEHRGATFRVPADWEVERRPRTLGAAVDGGPEIVSVAVFPLRRAYRPDLWDEAVNEVEVVARDLAARLSASATVGTGHTTIVDGRRARVFEISYASGGQDLIERVGFTFTGRREYQLTCRIDRRERELGEDACAELFRSFRA